MSDYNIDEKLELNIPEDGEELRVLTVGVNETDAENAGTERDFLLSMDELDELARSCRMNPVARVTQNLPHAGNAYYVGSGKLEEIHLYLKNADAQLIIFNDTLSPSQLRNLQQEFEIPVMDRTALILEIFRSRARSRESRLQVEYARLGYIRTRLVGMWDTLGRKGGASGAQSSRGEGETQLELDRRAIDRRLAELRRELRKVSGEREIQRKKRQSAREPLVALVGYTNAGKSTIMNSLIEKYSGPEEKKVFEANMLFATLDASVRRIHTGGSNDFLLSDTVGFIHKLPHGLVEAFQSTLEEVTQADLLLHVVDISDENYRQHMEVTQKTIADLGAGHIPQLIVYNKADLAQPPIDYPKTGSEHAGPAEKSIFICARENVSTDLLVQTIGDCLFGICGEETFEIPYADGAAVNEIMEHSEVISCEYEAEGTVLKVCCSRPIADRFRKYLRETKETPYTVSVETMRRSDAAAIENEVPSRELMRRAGEAIYQYGLWKAPVGIVCGKGNNAGDGYVAADYMKRAGIECELILLDAERFSEDGEYYFRRCVTEGIPVRLYRPRSEAEAPSVTQISDLQSKENSEKTEKPGFPKNPGKTEYPLISDLSQYASLLDCILGTGFHGDVTGITKDVIEAINASGAYVVSADINSGLNGDTGMGSTYVVSDLTVSIGTFKHGHFRGLADEAMKKKVNADIGIRIINEAEQIS